jgi:hypothetical protein
MIKKVKNLVLEIFQKLHLWFRKNGNTAGHKEIVKMKTLVRKLKLLFG